MDWANAITSPSGQAFYTFNRLLIRSPEHSSVLRLRMASCQCSPPSTLLILPPLFFKPPGFHLLTGASDAVRVAHKSIASNVERFLELLHKLRSQNALLDRALSFPSYLRNCCHPQVNCTVDTYW